MENGFVAEISDKLTEEEINHFDFFHKGKKKKILFLKHLVTIRGLHLKNGGVQVCSTQIGKALGITHCSIRNYLIQLEGLGVLECVNKKYVAGKQSKHYRCTNPTLFALFDKYHSKFQGDTRVEGISRAHHKRMLLKKKRFEKIKEINNLGFTSKRCYEFAWLYVNEGGHCMEHALKYFNNLIYIDESKTESQCLAENEFCDVSPEDYYKCKTRNDNLLNGKFEHSMHYVARVNRVNYNRAYELFYAIKKVAKQTRTTQGGLTIRDVHKMVKYRSAHFVMDEPKRHIDAKTIYYHNNLEMHPIFWSDEEIDAYSHKRLKANHGKRTFKNIYYSGPMGKIYVNRICLTPKKDMPFSDFHENHKKYRKKHLEKDTKFFETHYSNRVTKAF
jgi:hypothetical protein